MGLKSLNVAICGSSFVLFCFVGGGEKRKLEVWGMIGSVIGWGRKTECGTGDSAFVGWDGSVCERDWEGGMEIVSSSHNRNI